jgi:hypothetical protein
MYSAFLLWKLGENFETMLLGVAVLTHCARHWGHIVDLFYLAILVQSLMFSRQTLYHLSHAPSLCLLYFPIQSCIVAQDQPWTTIHLPMPPV